MLLIVSPIAIAFCEISAVIFVSIKAFSKLLINKHKLRRYLESSVASNFGIDVIAFHIECLYSPFQVNLTREGRV